MTSSLRVTTLSILSRWFPLILDESRHETSCIRKVISLSFYSYVKCPKRSSDATWTSILVLILPHDCSNGRDNIIIPVASVRILFRWLPLIPDEFQHEISCIRKIIPLSFCAYVKHSKRSSNVTWTSILVWMLPRHNSYGHDDVIMPVAIMRTLVWWFSLILNEFWHEASCIRNVILLSFYAYIKHLKQGLDATWTSVLVLMLICHSSNENDDVSNARCCYFGRCWRQWRPWVLSL
jgi:hypothetical protein